MPESRIKAQIQVMNKAYQPAGFKFQLMAISRTTNPQWYTMSQACSCPLSIKLSVRLLTKNTAWATSTFHIKPHEVHTCSF